MNSMRDADTDRTASDAEANSNVPMRDLLQRFLISALLVAGVSVVALPVRAIAGEDSLQQVIDRVEHDNDCKVLGVQVMEHDGRKVYVIKMLTRDGRVKVVQVRAS